MRDWITKDFGWKIFSVALAVAVWFTIENFFEPVASGEQGVEITYSDVPVIVVSLPEGKRAQIVPATVSVKVSGPANVMSVLQAKELHPFINLDDVSRGRDLQRAVEVAARTGVTVVNVDPPQVTVTISSLSETNQEKSP